MYVKGDLYRYIDYMTKCHIKVILIRYMQFYHVFFVSKCEHIEASVIFTNHAY